MAKDEGENANFDDLLTPGSLEELTPLADDEALPSAESPLGDLSDLSAAADLGPEAEAEQPDEVEEAVEPETGRKLRAYMDYAAIGAVVVVLIALGAAGIVVLSTAIYGVALALVAFGVWKERESATIYTVILAISLAFLLTAVYCLWLQWGRYQFDTKARAAKQPIAMTRMFVR